MYSALAKTASNDLPDIDIARRIAVGDCDALRVMLRHYNQTHYRTARRQNSETSLLVELAFSIGYERARLASDAI